MRVVRSLLGGCVGVVAFIVVVTTLSSTPPAGPAIHSLVSHTNHQLHQLHTLKAELEGKMENNAKYLDALGFIDKPIQYPHHTWDNITTPVLATAVSSGELWQVEGLINHAASVAPNLTVAVYTLDVSQQEIDKLENMCNLTCLVIKFDFNAYPSHLRDLKLKAFRPVIIQELLLRSGAVLWLDAKIRLAESEGYAGTKSPQTEQESGGSWMVASSNDMSEWSRRAVKSGGVLAWPLKEPQLMPTSALTHPNMFTFFHTPKHNYDFHQMSDASTVLVYNLPHVHKELMKPWVGCALTHNCISPIGAQDTGCRYDKKPLFRYSGCHHYDESAFNVALGVMFDQDTRPYLAPTNPFIIASKTRPLLTDDAPEEDNRDLSSREMLSKDLPTSHEDPIPQQIPGIPTSKQIGREKEPERHGASSLVNRIINNVSSGKS